MARYDDNEKVGMRIVEFTTTEPWREHKGWNRPAVEVGTIRYAIAYSLGGYFTYSYLDREQAVRVMSQMRFDSTDTKRFYEFNLERNIQYTIPVKCKGGE